MKRGHFKILNRGQIRILLTTGALCHALDPVGPRYLEGDGRFFSLHTMLVNSREVALEPHRRLTEASL